MCQQLTSAREKKTNKQKTHANKTDTWSVKDRLINFRFFEAIKYPIRN